MKRLILGILVGLIVILFLVSFIFIDKSNNVNDDNEDVVIEVDNKEYVHYINKDEYYELINNKESFMIVISRTGCMHCTTYVPVYEQVLKDYKVEGYVIDIANIEGESDFIKDIGIRGTPTTLFFEDGEEVLSNRIVGGREYDKLVSILKEINYIKRD